MEPTCEGGLCLCWHKNCLPYLEDISMFPHIGQALNTQVPAPPYVPFFGIQDVACCHLLEENEIHLSVIEGRQTLNGNFDVHLTKSCIMCGCFIYMCESTHMFTQLFAFVATYVCMQACANVYISTRAYMNGKFLITFGVPSMHNRIKSCICAL